MHRPTTTRAAVVLLLAVVTSACSFSFSIGGLDYEALEDGIAEELNASYASIGRSVEGVDCPEPDEDPGVGDQLVCTATLEGQAVRVQATVEDEDFNVTFNTLDVVYELTDTAELLAADISEAIGVPVNLNCGQGITVVPIGDGFQCSATDAGGGTATIQVTANDIEDTSWEILE